MPKASRTEGASQEAGAKRVAKKRKIQAKQPKPLKGEDGNAGQPVGQSIGESVGIFDLFVDTIGSVVDGAPLRGRDGAVLDLEYKSRNTVKSQCKIPCRELVESDLRNAFTDRGDSAVLAKIRPLLDEFYQDLVDSGVREHSTLPLVAKVRETLAACYELEQQGKTFNDNPQTRALVLVTVWTHPFRKVDIQAYNWLVHLKRLDLAQIPRAYPPPPGREAPSGPAQDAPKLKGEVASLAARVGRLEERLEASTRTIENLSRALGIAPY